MSFVEGATASMTMRVCLENLATGEPRNKTRKISSDIWRVFFPGGMTMITFMRFSWGLS